MVNRTKTHLVEAFKKLAEKKSFEKITIQDICEESGYNRQTFYYHFHDIYDMIEWVVKSDIEAALFEGDEVASWHEGVLRIARYMMDNRRVVMNLCVSLNREELKNYLYAANDRLARTLIEKSPGGTRISKRDADFIANMLKYVNVGFMLDWVKGGLAEDPETFAEEMDRIFGGTLERALMRCAAKNSVGFRPEKERGVMVSTMAEISPARKAAD